MDQVDNSTEQRRDTAKTREQQRQDQDNSLDAAAKETTRFMEAGEQPGHAGVGDAG